MKKSVATSASAHDIIAHLRSLENPANVAGMVRFGINGANVLGIKVPVLRAYAKEIGKNHALAIELWQSDIHEARILASMLADPKQATSELLDTWVKDFDTWDLCDQTCMNFFVKTPFAKEKIFIWSQHPEEFVKRAAFALIACFANGHKNTPNSFYLDFLPLIERESDDERNFVKKSVNWALRGIGKRNLFLNQAVSDFAKKLVANASKTTRWIASDALRDIQRPVIIARLTAKELR